MSPAATVAAPLAARIDVRALACPMTWVRTRVALGRLPHGAVLEVLLRDGEPRESVPRTAAEEGHRVLRLELAPEEGAGIWRVWLERGAAVEETTWP